MQKQQYLKIQGIHMTTKQWINMLKDPYKSEALAELKGDQYKLLQTRNSLSSALNKFDWDSSIKGRAYWEHIVNDLHNGNQTPYMDYETITQLID